MFAQLAARSGGDSTLDMCALRGSADVCVLRSQQGMCVGAGDAMPPTWRHRKALAQWAPRRKRWGGLVSAFCGRGQAPQGCSQAEGLLVSYRCPAARFRAAVLRLLVWFWVKFLAPFLVSVSSQNLGSRSVQIVQVLVASFGTQKWSQNWRQEFAKSGGFLTPGFGPILVPKMATSFRAKVEQFLR